MRSNKQILIEARARIESGWTQHASARDEDGKKVLPSSPRACSWCVTGAVWDDHLDAYQALAKTLGVTSSLDLQEFNDRPGQTKENILRFFDAAINQS